MGITAACFTGFDDGKKKANITALKRQTESDWRCRKVGTQVARWQGAGLRNFLKNIHTDQKNRKEVSSFDSEKIET